MANTPSDIAAQVLDAIGSDFVLGDIQDGVRESQVLLRAYSQCLMQLLRAVHWNFARKSAPLTLLADASGATPNVGTTVSLPWVYEYALPTDALKARFVPLNQPTTPNPPPGNIAIPPTPLTTGSVAAIAMPRVVPARFLVATDFNYPPAALPPQWWEVPGVSPGARTVILTNVQNAQLVYTAKLPWPNLWDPQFRAAFVSYMASEVALPLTKDRKFGLQIRAQMIASTKEKIMQARITDGDEGWAQNDHTPDWIRARRSAGPVGWGGLGIDGAIGPGNFWYGWDSASFADGSVY